MLVRRIRDAFGDRHFNALTAAINAATTPRVVLEGGGGGPVNINLGSNNQVGSVNIGDVAGGNIIKDNLFIIQGDNPLAIQAIEDRVTTVFFNDLKGLTSKQRAIFLFDSYERTSLDESRWLANAADRWISGQLLRRVREGDLPNVLVVLAGRRLPQFGIEWQDVVGRMPLENFVEEDVAQYLRENRGLSTLTDAEIRTLFTAVQGNPQLMGIIGDNLTQANRPVPDEEW
jgi:hypothetical protein